MTTRTTALLMTLALCAGAAMADGDRGKRFDHNSRGGPESRDSRDGWVSPSGRDRPARPDSQSGPPAADNRPAAPRFVPQDSRHDGNRHGGRNDGYSDSRHDRPNVRHQPPSNDSYGRYDNRNHNRYDNRNHNRYDNRYDNRYGSRYGSRNDSRYVYGSNRNSYRDHRGRDWYYAPHWYQSYRSRYFRFDAGRYFSRNRFSIGIYLAPRGYSHRTWRVGQHLPYGYYDRTRYELHDYWRFDLYDPPYWACWVRVGDDALLVDSDTGEVIDAVYDLFY